MVAVLAHLCLSLAPTIDLPPMPLGRMLPELSKQYGVKLKASQALSDEVVMIRAKGWTLDQVKERLADTVYAQWKKGGDEQILWRSQGYETELFARESAARAKALEPLLRQDARRFAGFDIEARAKLVFDAVKKLHDGIANPPDRPQQNPVGPHGEHTARMLLAEIALALGADMLAALPEAQAVVYSDSPTTAQKMLPEESRQPLARFLQVQKTLERMFRDYPELTKPSGLDVHLDQVRAASDYGKTNVKLERHGDRVSVSLFIYSGAGDSLCRAGAAYWPGVQNGNAAKISDSKQWVPLAKATTEFLDASVDAGDWISPRVGKAWSQPLQEILSQPEDHDPLTLLAGKGVETLAEHQDFVANLPDRLFSLLMSAVVGKNSHLDPVKVKSLLEQRRYECKGKDGWTQVRPSDPMATTTERLSRSALGRCMRQTIRDKRMTFRNLAIFHYEAPGRGNSHILANHYFSALEYGGYPLVPAYTSTAPELFALLGSLANDTWTALHRGESIRIASLPSRAVDHAWRFMGDGMMQKAPDAKTLPDLFLQPSESFPNGVPSGAFLQFRSSTEILLQIEMPIPMRPEFARAISPERVGENAADRKSDREIEQELAAREYIPGSKRKDSYSLHLSPELLLKEDISYAEWGKKVGWASLPKEYKDKIWAGVRKRHPKRDDGGSSKTVDQL